jgi:hypothetical protein
VCVSELRFTCSSRATTFLINTTMFCMRSQRCRESKPRALQNTRWNKGFCTCGKSPLTPRIKLFRATVRNILHHPRSCAAQMQCKNSLHQMPRSELANSLNRSKTSESVPSDSRRDVHPIVNFALARVPILFCVENFPRATSSTEFLRTHVARAAIAGANARGIRGRVSFSGDR